MHRPGACQIRLMPDVEETKGAAVSRGCPVQVKSCFVSQKKKTSSPVCLNAKGAADLSCSSLPGVLESALHVVQASAPILHKQLLLTSVSCAILSEC